MHLKVGSELRKTQKKGRKLIKELRKIATELDKVHFGSNVSRVAGSAAAIAGTVVSLTGGILAFFTFGTSLILVIVGASVATAGGITASGGFVADKVISKKKLRKLQTLYDDFLKDSYAAEMLGRDHISNEGSTTGRAFVITGLVFDTILLPVTIYDLVTSNLELHRKSGHPGGESVRNCIGAINSIDHAITRYTTLPMDSTNDKKEPGGLKNTNFNGSFGLV